MSKKNDFVNEIVAERTSRNRDFPSLVEAAERRRELLRELGDRRERAGVSQTVVAARMATSQSAIARLESGEADAKMSTIERYAAAIGQKVEWKVTRVS